jgi:hypothetical protein
MIISIIAGIKKLSYPLELLASVMAVVSDIRKASPIA